MKGIESAIYYAEYCISLLRWGITSLRSFPTIQKTKSDESKPIESISRVREGD